MVRRVTRSSPDSDDTYPGEEEEFGTKDDQFLVSDRSENKFYGSLPGATSCNTGTIGPTLGNLGRRFQVRDPSPGINLTSTSKVLIRFYISDFDLPMSGYIPLGWHGSGNHRIRHVCYQNGCCSLPPHIYIRPHHRRWFRGHGLGNILFLIPFFRRHRSGSPDHLQETAK